MATFDDIINRTITRLSQLTGASVQTYSIDRIGEMVQHKFDVLFDETWWHQFMYWEPITLSNTTGEPAAPTADLTALSNPLKRFDDIKAIYPPNSNKPLPYLPENVNPDNITGSAARFVEPVGTTGKIFRILPVTVTDVVNMHYRSKPDNFVTGDTVNFDDQALILGATYDYLEDDGTNPGATEKMKDMFESRVRQLKKLRAQLPSALDPRLTETLDEWREIS